MTMEELKSLDTAFVSVTLNGNPLGRGTVHAENDHGQVFLGYGDVYLAFRPDNAMWDGALHIKTTL